MVQSGNLPWVVVPSITFGCKTTKDCQGQATYTFSKTIVSRAFSFGSSARNKQPLVPTITNQITPANAYCSSCNHRAFYDVIFFKCKTDGCSQYVLGTTDATCTDKSRIFVNNKARLKCCEGHENEYQLP